MFGTNSLFGKFLFTGNIWFITYVHISSFKAFIACHAIFSNLGYLEVATIASDFVLSVQVR